MEDSDLLLGGIYRDFVSRSSFITAYPTDEQLLKYSKWAKEIISGDDPVTTSDDFMRYMRIWKRGRECGIGLQGINYVYISGGDIQE